MFNGDKLADAIAYGAVCKKTMRLNRASSIFPKGQKFMAGTKVHITKDLGHSMKHFPSDCDALVDHSYAELYGGDDILSYSLTLLNSSGNETGSVAWYKEDQLTEIKD